MKKKQESLYGWYLVSGLLFAAQGAIGMILVTKISPWSCSPSTMVAVYIFAVVAVTGLAVAFISWLKWAQLSSAGRRKR